MLLINRRIYNEASHVFFSENYFAFEERSLLSGFLANMSERSKSLITRISFMPRVCEDSSTLSRFESGKEMQKCWSLLKSCSGLVELELDAVLLTQLKLVSDMRLLRVARRVSFVHATTVGRSLGSWRRVEYEDFTAWRLKDSTPNGQLWPLYASRQDIRGENPLAERLARSIETGRPMKVKVLREAFAQSLI